MSPTTMVFDSKIKNVSLLLDIIEILFSLHMCIKNFVLQLKT